MENYGERVQNCILSECSYPKGNFDVVTLWYVLEHVSDPALVIAEALGMLRSGGLIFIAVPNWRYIKFRRMLGRILKGRPTTVHPHEHLYQYTPDILSKFLKRNGVILVMQDVANPYQLAGGVTYMAKRFGSLAVRTLWRVSGINLGGVLILGRKG
jgi:2-polyprenyl-3-methyl-5-hydroxy-6-metoxy-1,4-benzoquinol methylase